jgi:hypothetical protein
MRLRENDTYFTVHLPGEHYGAVYGAPTAPTESVSSQSPPIGTSFVSGQRVHVFRCRSPLCATCCASWHPFLTVRARVWTQPWIRIVLIVMAKSLRHLAGYASEECVRSGAYE